MPPIRLFAAAALLVTGFAYAQAPAQPVAPSDRYVITSLGRTLRVADDGLKVVRRVEPVPPRRALERETQGQVIVEALIDTAGKVADVKVVKGLPNGLIDATVSAVRQWQFEPYLEDGQPIPVLYHVTVTFRVNGWPVAASTSMVETSLGATVRIDHPKYAPKVLKRVNPHYPETARAAGTTGVVKMDVLIDARGEVVDVKVLSGVPNGLTEAAVSAARQWKFKPFARDGNAWPVLFPVVMSFKL